MISNNRLSNRVKEFNSEIVKFAEDRIISNVKSSTDYKMSPKIYNKIMSKNIKCSNQKY